MLDPAEQWLRDNDPDYAESRKAWKDIPDQEIPWGLHVEGLVDHGQREYVEPVGERACECGRLFVPTTPWQEFCRRACRQRAYRRRVTHS